MCQISLFSGGSAGSKPLKSGRFAFHLFVSCFFLQKINSSFPFLKQEKKTYDLSVMLMHSLTADLSTGPIPVKSLTGLFRDQIFANKYIRRDNQEHCAARNKETEAANCGSCPTHTLPIPLRGNIRLSSEGRWRKICEDVNHSVFESL